MGVASLDRGFPSCDLCCEGLEGGVGGLELKAAVGGVGRFRDLVESEEGGGGAVVGLYVGRVEAESGRAVERGGSIVFCTALVE